MTGKQKPQWWNAPIGKRRRKPTNGGAAKPKTRRVCPHVKRCIACGANCPDGGEACWNCGAKL